MQTIQHVQAAQVGAQTAGGMACSVKPPKWYMDGDDRSRACGPGAMRQCNGVFAATVDVTMATAGTLTFDVSASNFQKFKPVGLQFYASDPATPTADHTRGFTATALNFAGRNFLGTTVALNLIAFSVNGQRAMSAVDLPTLVPGGQDVTLTVQNVDTATNLTLYGWMFGYALR